MSVRLDFFSLDRPAGVKEQINPEAEIIKPKKWEVVFITMSSCEGQWEPHYQDNKWKFVDKKKLKETNYSQVHPIFV